jgi:nicotinamidase/pyrazinamidase
MPGAMASLGRGDALLLVDVQNDFCPGGALPVEGGDAVVPVLNQWIRAARARGVPIYASQDWHPRGHPSFASCGGPWPVHCVQGSPGARFHAALELPEDAVVVAKGVRLDRDQLSAFDETGLAARLRADGIRRVFVGGLALDVCVRASIEDAIAAGFETYLLSEGARAVDPARGRETVSLLLRAGARVVGAS